jgi:hypothetical protein
LKVISKREIGNPKGSTARYQRNAESATDSPPKVDATWNTSLAHIFIPEINQRRTDRFKFVVWFRSHHNVDDWFSQQPGNGCAPDVLDRDICRQAN